MVAGIVSPEALPIHSSVPGDTVFSVRVPSLLASLPTAIWKSTTPSTAGCTVLP